jgi:hypothetical protein
METLFFVAVIAASSRSEPAAQAIGEATAKHYQIDKALEAYQARLMTESQRRQVGRIAAVARVGIERQVTFKFEF